MFFFVLNDAQGHCLAVVVDDVLAEVKAALFVEPEAAGAEHGLELGVRTQRAASSGGFHLQNVAEVDVGDEEAAGASVHGGEAGIFGEVEAAAELPLIRTRRRKAFVEDRDEGGAPVGKGI